MVQIDIEFDEEVETDCPLCKGTGRYIFNITLPLPSRELDFDDTKEVNIRCPCCDGVGKVKVQAQGMTTYELEGGR